MGVSGTEERKSWEKKYGFEWVAANWEAPADFWHGDFLEDVLATERNKQGLPQPLLWLSVSVQSPACFNDLYFLCEFVPNISESSLGSQVSSGGSDLPGSLASSC